MDLQLDLISLIVSALVGIVVGDMYRRLVKFTAEQRKVNAANAMANRSVQRDVLYRYFRIVVEQGQSITPEELEHINRCYTAYHENGGNGTGTTMYERIKEHARINTGRA